MSEKERPVGFVGMGRMGRPMAGRLLEAGFPVVVQNRTRSACDEAAALGAEVVDSPREVAERCEVVFTMLADGAAAEQVYRGPGGLLEAIGPGMVLVEMSTIGPALATSLAEDCAGRGASLLDAPVSGSITAAAAGVLLFMVGGEEAALSRVSPYLEAMSAKQIHLGASGGGAAMKLAVNCVVATTNAALAEALALAEGYGIEGERAYDVLESSAVASPFVKVKRRGYLQPDEEAVFFSVDLMLKDVELAATMAAEVGAALPSAAATALGLALARDAGAGAADFSAVAEILRQYRGGAGARAGSQPPLELTDAARKRLAAATSSIKREPQ